MSGCSNLARSPIAWLLTVILFTLGCASAKNISYTPGGMIDPWFRESGPKIFIKEFEDTSGDVGKVMGPWPFCSGAYVSDLNCPQLFKDAFTKEFQALGLQVVENMNAAQIIMNGTILRFDDDKPFASQIWTGAVQVKLEFLDQSKNTLLQMDLKKYLSCYIEHYLGHWRGLLEF